MWRFPSQRKTTSRMSKDVILRGPFMGARGEVEVATGTVKWFNDKKGFGFITPDDGGKDFFAHYSEIVSDGFRTLQEGQQVEFEAGEGPKGPQATKIRPL